MWTKLKLNSFIKNIAILLSGTAIAQVLSILATPFLTRLYSPEAYGILAIYISIVTILFTIMTLRYEMAIVLPKTEKDAANLLVLSIGIVTMITILLFILNIPFRQMLAEALGSPELTKWLWLVPISAFFMGVYNALNYWSTRKNILRGCQYLGCRKLRVQ